MSTINNSSINHNKGYGNDDDDEHYTYQRCVDVTFNKLMDSRQKYIGQAVAKFNYFRINSQVTFFDIDIGDLDESVKRQLGFYTKGCKTHEESYHKLNGIIVEVVSLIFKQAEPLILANTEYEDPVWIKKSINEIGTTVSGKWRF